MAVEISDGNVEFRIAGKDYTCDLLELKLLCEQWERDEALAEVDGLYTPTHTQLESLAERIPSILKPEGSLGNLSGTGAWQIWEYSGQQVSRLKKNMSETQK